MSAANLYGTRDRRGRASGPAAMVIAPPAPLGRTSPDAQRHTVRAGERVRRADNFCRVRREVELGLRRCAAAAASPIGLSPGRHASFHADGALEFVVVRRRPPSPRFRRERVQREWPPQGIHGVRGTLTVASRPLRAAIATAAPRLLSRAKTREREESWIDAGAMDIRAMRGAPRPSGADALRLSPVRHSSCAQPSHELRRPPSLAEKSERGD